MAAIKQKPKAKKRSITNGTMVTWVILLVVVIVGLVLAVFYGDRIATFLSSSAVPTGQGSKYISTASTTTPNVGQDFTVTVTVDAKTGTVDNKLFSGKVVLQIDRTHLTFKNIVPRATYASAFDIDPFDDAGCSITDTTCTPAFYDAATGNITINVGSTAGVTGIGRPVVQVTLTATTAGAAFVNQTYTARNAGPSYAVIVENSGGTDTPVDVLDGTTASLPLTVVVPQPAPTVTSITPASVVIPLTQNVTVSGTNFVWSGASDTVKLVAGGTTKQLTNVQVVNNTTITATVDASTGLTAGTYDVVATVGTLSGTKTGAFTVTQLAVPDAPTVDQSNVTPTFAARKYINTSTKATFAWTVDAAKQSNQLIDYYEYKFWDTTTTEPASYTKPSPQNATSVILTGTALPLVNGPAGQVRGLLNGHTYSFKVRGHNPAGNSTDAIVTFVTQTANLDYTSVSGTETVSGLDLSYLLQRWGQSAGAGQSGEIGDLFDGPPSTTLNKIDGFDLSILLQRWGQSI